MSARYEDIQLIHTTAQPTRLQILKILINSQNYATQLERTLGVHRRVISFHLVALEDKGLVESKYGLSEDGKRPQAVRYYTITPKGREICTLLLQMLKRC